MHFREVAEQVLEQIRHEKESEAHQIFRAHRGHGVKQEADYHETIPGITHPGSTGVIFVMDRAMKNGFSYENPEWANFGQGAPETGHIPDAMPKPGILDLDALGDGVHEYAPTTGILPLREAVADYYNTTYRQGKQSQYGPENVCIVPGGRAGLARLAAVIGDVNCGYQLPEYTAYESMLSVFKRLVPIPTLLEEADEWKLKVDNLAKEIRNRGLSVVCLSNPRNPTGQVIEGEELNQLTKLADGRCTIILDEFYSWYQHEGELGRGVSAAEYVEDVNRDSVILIDGLTKNWRCPGWRVCWVVGPKEMISALNQSGSYLDGGSSHPMQCLALQMLEPDRIRNDRLALQKHFRLKRNHVLKRLAEMGLPVKVPPKATFYIWLNLSSLPHPLNSGLVFFEELLKEKVIVVPGIFFDVNPSHRRNLVDSPCEQFVRLSFGPPLDQLDKGLDGMARVLEKARQQHPDLGKNLARGDNGSHAMNLQAPPGAAV